MKMTETIRSPFHEEVEIDITQLEHARDLPLPAYATSQSAGMDLLAAIDRPLTLNPGDRILIPSGIAIALPQGYEAQIRPRSGLAIQSGITVLNAPGTIDSDYRGEIMGIMINLGQNPFVFTRGMRFAQLVISSYRTVLWKNVDILEETLRGEKRFGSTGL
jgi:dUTP pyrophosphatase